ncbi:MAG: hypothetical protein ABIH23_00630 [bacterium]
MAEDRTRELRIMIWTEGPDGVERLNPTEERFGDYESARACNDRLADLLISGSGSLG